MDTWIENLKLAPALAALVMVVYLFIRAQQWMIKHSEEVAKDRAELYTKSMRDITAEHISEREKSRQVIDRVVVSNTELCITLAKLDGTVRELKDRHIGGQK